MTLATLLTAALVLTESAEQKPASPVTVTDMVNAPLDKPDTGEYPDLTSACVGFPCSKSLSAVAYVHTWVLHSEASQTP